MRGPVSAWTKPWISETSRQLKHCVAIYVHRHHPFLEGKAILEIMLGVTNGAFPTLYLYLLVIIAKDDLPRISMIAGLNSVARTACQNPYLLPYSPLHCWRACTQQTQAIRTISIAEFPSNNIQCIHHNRHHIHNNLDSREPRSSDIWGDSLPIKSQTCLEWDESVCSYGTNECPTSLLPFSHHFHTRRLLPCLFLLLNVRPVALSVWTLPCCHLSVQSYNSTLSIVTEWTTQHQTTHVYSSMSSWYDVWTLNCTYNTTNISL